MKLVIHYFYSNIQRHNEITFLIVWLKAPLLPIQSGQRLRQTTDISDKFCKLILNI